MESDRILQAIEWLKIGSKPMPHGQTYLLAPIDFSCFFWGYWDDYNKKFYDSWDDEICKMHWCCKNIWPEYMHAYFIESINGSTKRVLLPLPPSNDNANVRQIRFYK